MKKIFTGFNEAPSLRRFIASSGKLFALLAALVFLSGMANAEVQIGSASYSTLAAAFDAINAGTHTGAITVLINSNTTETAQPWLKPGNVAPANWSSVTIRPTGQYTITANSGYQNVYITASNVTIDGSITVGGTTRDLTFANIGTDAANSGNVYIKSGSNVTVKNVIMYCKSSLMPWGVFAETATNVTIQNCRIYRAAKGVCANTNTSNISIIGCEIGSTTNEDAIRYFGVDLRNTNTFVIRNCDINGLYNDDAVDRTLGIYTVDGINGTISKNKIHHQRSLQNNCYGMRLDGSSAEKDLNITASNNFIYDIACDTRFILGMIVNNASNVRLYNNTVHLYGSNSGGAGYNSAGLYVSTGSSKLSVVNNIFKVLVYGPNGAFGIYSPYTFTTSPYQALDYNCYYVVTGGTNYIGSNNGVNYSTLSDWKKNVSDPHSISDEPVFVADDNMHLTGSSIGSTFQAPRLSAVTDDFEGETRNDPTYMGADEVSPILALTQDLTQFTSPFCDGSTATMTVAAAITGFADNVARNVTNPSFNYEWYHNGTKMPGQTSSTLTISNIKASDAGQYKAIIKLGGISLNSSVINLAVESPLVITSIPPAQFDICENSASLPLVATATGTITGYQWQKETAPGVWSDIAGETNLTFNLVNDPATVEGNYRIEVKGPGNCGDAAVFSNPVKVTIARLLKNPHVTYDVNPGNICLDEDLNLTANVEGTITGYQWQIFSNGQFVDLDPRLYPTADQKNFLIHSAKIENSGLYRAKILGSPNCDLKEVYTDAVNVIVWNPFQILQQPQSDLVCYGGTVNLVTVAIGTIHSYQWQKDGKNISLSENPTANSPILTMDKMTEKSSGAYTCVINAEDCLGLRDIKTVPALVYVLEDTKVMKVTQTQAVQLGGKATFEVVAHAQGAPGNYQVNLQWYRGDQPLQDNDRISGTKSSILTIVDVQPGDVGNDYWVAVTGLCGVDTAKSIELLTPGVDIKSQPVSVNKCEGETATLSVTTEVVGGGKSLEYQWFRNGQPIEDAANISGTTSATLTITNLTKADAASDYFVQVTVQPGNATVSSEQAAIGVDSKPTIKTQPAKTVSINANEKLDLSVEAEGNNLNYQWSKDGQPINGANSASYVVDRADQSHEGRYTVKVWNNCGEIYSDTASVVVTYYKIQLGVDDNNSQIESLTNEPNPFNGQTTIIFSAEKGSNAQISITDIYGRQIAVIFNGASNGINSVTFNAASYNLASGVYYYTLTSGGRIFTKPMLLVK